MTEKEEGKHPAWRIKAVASKWSNCCHRRRQHLELKETSQKSSHADELKELCVHLEASKALKALEKHDKSLLEDWRES